MVLRVVALKFQTPSMGTRDGRTLNGCRDFESFGMGRRPWYCIG